MERETVLRIDSTDLQRGGDEEIGKEDTGTMVPRMDGRQEVGRKRG